MELKDRQSKYPGRITLRDVYTKVEKTYDVILADEATEQGTPLNAQTLTAFKADILNEAKAQIKPTINQTTIVTSVKHNDIY